MNIFLPYENDIEKSIQCIDNKRLIKQIQEAKVLLDGARAYEKGEVPNFYFKHPVAQHYKNEPEFLAYYGFQCCKEYWFRYNKYHQYYDYFENLCENWYKIKDIPAFTPYYMELPKSNPNHIRTTQFVGDLFQAKLIKKWLEDKKSPMWTNRAMPDFFEIYLSVTKSQQKTYWENIKKIKKEVKDVSSCSNRE